MDMLTIAYLLISGRSPSSQNENLGILAFYEKDSVLPHIKEFLLMNRLHVVGISQNRPDELCNEEGRVKKAIKVSVFVLLRHVS